MRKFLKFQEFVKLCRKYLKIFNKNIAKKCLSNFGENYKEIMLEKFDIDSIKLENIHNKY